MENIGDLHFCLFLFFVISEPSFLFWGLYTGVVCFHSSTHSLNKDVLSAYSESGMDSAMMASRETGSKETIRENYRCTHSCKLNGQGSVIQKNWEVG